MVYHIALAPRTLCALFYIKDGILYTGKTVAFILLCYKEQFGAMTLIQVDSQPSFDHPQFGMREQDFTEFRAAIEGGRLFPSFQCEVEIRGQIFLPGEGTTAAGLLEVTVSHDKWRRTLQRFLKEIAFIEGPERSYLTFSADIFEPPTKEKSSQILPLKTINHVEMVQGKVTMKTVTKAKTFYDLNGVGSDMAAFLLKELVLALPDQVTVEDPDFYTPHPENSSIL